MGAIAEQLTPSNIGFINAFYAANPVLGMVTAALLLLLFLAAISKLFKFGQRNESIDKAHEGHVKRLNDEIARTDVKFAQMEAKFATIEASGREKDSKIALLTGSVQYLTEKLDAAVKSYERLTIDYQQLQAVNAEQRAEIAQLERAQIEATRRIEAQSVKIKALEAAEMARSMGTNRRKTDPQDPVSLKTDPRDST